ncbi:YoaK family protein [Bradyrhizobium sp. USDA 4454]
MLSPFQHEPNCSPRLARAAAVCATSGKLSPAAGVGPAGNERTTSPQGDPAAAASALFDFTSRAIPLVLGVIAGSTDTIGFLGLNGLFTAHITGNLVVLSAHFVAGDPTILSHVLALPVFMLTLFFTRLLAGGLTRAGLSTLRPLLLTEVLFLVAFLVVCGVWGPWRDPNAILATIAGLLGVAAMAVQNALAQISLTNAPATSVMTTNVTRFVLDLGEMLVGCDHAKAAQARARAKNTFPVILGFSTGCLLGAAAESAVGLWSLALPAGLALAAFGISSTDRSSSITRIIEFSRPATLHEGAIP